MGVNRQTGSNRLLSDPKESQSQLQPCFNQQTVQWKSLRVMGVTNTVELPRYSESQDTVELDIRYSQETVQNKNIHKYKPQMIYFRNYTGTPTHLLAQFLQNP